jgi:hypothetical protein
VGLSGAGRAAARRPPAAQGDPHGGLVEAIGPGPPLEDAPGLDELGVGQLVGQHRRVGERVDRVALVAHDQRRSGDLASARRRRRDPAEEEPVHDGRHGVGPLVARVETDADPERHQAARDRPGEQPHGGDREGQEASGEHERREGDDPGLHRVVEHRHLHEQPAHPLGSEVGHLERDVGPQRGAADDRLVGAEVVEERDDLLPEGGHRVGQRVGGAVGTPVAEQVDGDDVEALGGQGPRQGLVHPARHQLAVDQDDPLVARAVLGVLEPVARARGLEEELADPLRHQHDGNLTNSTARKCASRR